LIWQPGDAIVRREIVGGAPWLGWMVNVVEDSPNLLAIYSPPGSRFHFPPGDWPTPDGRHPWHGYQGWQGQGTLMLQRPRDCYAVWLFWDGPDREFQGWYINLESPFTRTEIGIDTMDLELDIVVAPDRSWSMKDVDLLWQRRQEGRFSLNDVRSILDLGDGIGRMLDDGDWWWDDEWIGWEPDPAWAVPAIPRNWELVDCAIQPTCEANMSRPVSYPQRARPRRAAFSR
jgi:hypothetical protein